MIPVETIMLDAFDLSFSWNMFLEPQSGETIGPPIATAIGLPIPRVGDTIFHEACNGPLTVTRVVWGLRKNCAASVDVFVK